MNKKAKKVREDAAKEVNESLNPLFERLVELERGLHNKGYHMFSNQVADLRSKIDAAHHDFVDTIFELGA